MTSPRISIRSLIAAAALAAAAVGCQTGGAASGSVSLLDTNSLKGWHSFKKPDAPKQGWEVVDGVLHHIAKGGGGDIVSEQTYEEFDLEWDWKVSSGGNSGLKYFVTDDRTSALGHEYQMIDDEIHADAKRGPKWQTASFYDVFPPSNKELKPVGQYNHSRVLVKGNEVTHWLNGKKVLTYGLGTPETLAAVQASKFKNVAGFGTRLRGHILIQDHGDEVWVRNLRIKDLSAAAAKP